MNNFWKWESIIYGLSNTLIIYFWTNVSELEKTKFDLSSQKSKIRPNGPFDFESLQARLISSTSR